MSRAKTPIFAALVAGLFLAAESGPAAAAAMGWLGPRDVGTGTSAQQQWLLDAQSGCQVLDSAFASGDSVNWQGACVGGMASGNGRLTVSNNTHVVETITGNFWQGTLRPGHVVANWSDGTSYDGGQSGGQFDGQGRFVSAGGDRIEGSWKAGALNGTATMQWANGDRYDGNWRDGKPDGQGLEVWANGDRFQGTWKDGKPLRTHDAAPATGPATGPVTATAETAPGSSAIPLGAIGQTTSAAAAANTTAPDSDSLPLRNIIGVPLAAVDGSKLSLEPTEGGMIRMVVLQGGESQKISFSFMSDHIGTVSEDTAPIGVFRSGENEIDIDFADGQTETMKGISGGGLRLEAHDAGGHSACTAWYPEGHPFTQEEKTIAVEEYARRMGVSGIATPKTHRAANAEAHFCGGGFLSEVARRENTQSNSTASEGLPVPTPPEKAAALLPGTKSAASGTGQSMEAVPVRDSSVHPIDAPSDLPGWPARVQSIKYAPATDAPPLASGAGDPVAPPPIPANASQCLSVGSDGTYWGFRNRCAATLQFAYCEMNNANPLTSCQLTSVSGSVSAKGFSPLVNDRSLSEQNAEHEFRWMACEGGAGEVVAHLDNFDPPAGRCLHAVSAAGTIPNPAGS